MIFGIFLMFSSGALASPLCSSGSYDIGYNINDASSKKDLVSALGALAADPDFSIVSLSRLQQVDPTFPGFYFRFRATHTNAKAEQTTLDLLAGLNGIRVDCVPAPSPMLQ